MARQFGGIARGLVRSRPRGAKAFGVAVLRDDGTYETNTVSFADEAAQWLGERGHEVVGAGIDAPLWWSSGDSGDRQADQWLRRHYKISGGTVQPMNSLRGAALVQGVMLAVRLRQRQSHLSITEAHPKALLKALWRKASKAGPTWVEVAERFGLQGAVLNDTGGDHERDAVLAAVVAREGSRGVWLRDLAGGRLPCEQDPASLAWGPVNYWWPGPELDSAR
jgi:predicted nuclease with RNAse H fold